MQIAGATTYFESPAMRVMAHPANQCAILQYKARPRTPTELSEALAATLALLEACAWHKLLSDRRWLSSPLSEAEVAQTGNFWRDYLASHADLLRVAALVSPVAYDALAATPALPATQQHQPTWSTWFRVFNQLDAAVVWLKRFE